MAEQRLTVRQVCDAALISRLTLGQWIKRGFIVPEEEGISGKARTFSIVEAAEIAVFAELSRGLALSEASEAARIIQPIYVGGHRISQLHLLKDEAAVLVVWHGPVELIPASEPGTPGHRAKELTDPRPAEHTFDDPDRPAWCGDIFGVSALPAIAANPDVRYMVVINLDHIEARVKAALEITDQGDD